MLHGDSKSQNSDYGSFCNTPSDTFGAVGGVGPSSGPGGGAYQQPTSGGDQHHRGHQRNDSEIQIGNVSSILLFLIRRVEIHKTSYANSL
jgi:hypothetical protein